MTVQVGIPLAVVETRRELLRDYLASWPCRGAVSIAPWWADVAEEFGVRIAPKGAGAGMGTDGLIAVDLLRAGPESAAYRASELSALLAERPVDTRLLFCEIDSVENPSDASLARALPDHDTTGELWASGISVVDVVRTPIDTGVGRWHLVHGVARRTPMVTEVVSS